MTELSPVAQAVLKKTAQQVLADRRINLDHIVAAALRAAADQVVPEEGDRWTRDLRGDAWIRAEERKLLRRELLAIAAELEAQ